MMQLKPNKNGTADIAEFSGFVSEKRSGILSITKIVLTLSVLLAILMVISR